MTKKFHLIIQICFLVLFLALGFVFHSLFFVQAADPPKTCWTKGFIVINYCEEIIEDKCHFMSIDYDCVLAGPILHRCIWTPNYGTAKRTNTCNGLCTGPGTLIRPLCSQQYTRSGCYN
jgi:hypothetical protein